MEIMQENEKKSVNCKVSLVSMDDESIEIDRRQFEESSGYFRSLLNSGMVDSRGEKLKFESLSWESLLEVQKYFKWLSSGGDYFTPDPRIYEIIEAGFNAAFYLQIDEMILIYTNKLSDMCNYTNLILVITITEKYCLETIEKMVMNCLYYSFDQVASSNKFQLFPPKYMKKVLECDKLCTKSEYFLFESLLKWLAHHEDCKWMLSLVRFELMESRELKVCDGRVRRSGESFKAVLEHSLTKANPQLIGLLKDQPSTSALYSFINPPRPYKHLSSLHYPLLNSINYHSPPATTLRMRNYVDLIMILGGFNEKEVSTNRLQLITLEVLEEKVEIVINRELMSKRRKKISNCIRLIIDECLKTHFASKSLAFFFIHSSKNLPTRLCEHQAGVLNGMLYTVGGQAKYSVDGSSTSAAVYKFNPLNATWTTCSKMHTPRSLFYLGILDNKMYAVGGSTFRNMDTPTVEWYDPFKDRWTMLNPLPTSIHEHAGCVHENTLFISGGFRGVEKGHTDLVWRYDTGQDSWAAMPHLRTPRSCHCMVGCGDRLFVVGGVRYLSDQEPLDILDAEMYSPQTGEWCKVLKLEYPASCMSHLFIHNNNNNNNNDNNNANNNNANNNANNNKESVLENKLLLFGGHSFQEEFNHSILQIIDLSRCIHGDGGHGDGGHGDGGHGDGGHGDHNCDSDAFNENYEMDGNDLKENFNGNDLNNNFNGNNESCNFDLLRVCSCGAVKRKRKESISDVSCDEYPLYCTSFYALDVFHFTNCLLKVPDPIVRQLII